MTNREILEDFIVFYFLQYEELYSKVVFFYNLENGEFLFDDSFEDFRYKNFIRHYIEIEEFIDNEFKPTKIDSLHDLISEDNIKNLVQYLNENFRHGHSLDDEPDAVEIEDIENDFIGFYNLDINKSEFINEFNDSFLELHKLNPIFYVSQLYQLFYYYFFYGMQRIRNEKEIIDGIDITKSVFPLKEKNEIDIYYDNRYKKNMLDSISIEPLQYHGFVDENGIFIDEVISLRNWMIVSNGIKLKHEFDFINGEKIGIDYLIYKYYRYKIYNEDTIEGSEDKINALKRDFNKVKQNNRKLIIFLNNKGFNDSESDTILNVLLNNNFTELNLRSFPYIKKQVEFFRFCYFFYIFDFFEEIEENNFSRESDFECLKINETYHVYRSDWKNQFKKYKKNLKNTNSRHFPFRKTVEKTLDTIENKLAIKREKLKSF